MNIRPANNFKWYSFVALVFVIAFILIGRHTLPRLKYDYYTKELTFDVTSYYLYLPMTFIYNDPGIENKAVIDTIFERYKPSPTFYQAFELENGNYVMNYTCGFAYAYAPFFFLADRYAKANGYLADGFSFPYQFFIGNGVFIYILAGWFFLRKVLLRFMDDKYAALSMIFICFGTNYFSEAINNYLQPHAMLFSAYCVLLYLIILWHEKPRPQLMVLAGLVMGWMILSRPSEIVCLLLPLLWNVYDKESLKAKWELIKKHYMHVIILAVSAFVVFIPQFIYWHKVTGSAIFFSYQRTEGFDFLKPHIINILFSFKKSLFVYTPIVIFFIIGLIRLRKHCAPISLAIITYAAANFYLLGSWAAWWNGGSFGLRYFAESYAVMALPMGLLLQNIAQRKFIVKAVASLALTFFVVLNLFQTWQFLNWIIPDDRMTYEYYKRIFFKTYASTEDRKYEEVIRSFASTESFTDTANYTPLPVAFYDFDNNNSTAVESFAIDSTFRHSGKYSCKLSEDNIYYPTFRIRYDELVPEEKDHVWLRVSLYFYYEGDIKEKWTSLVINMPHRKYNLKYRAFDLYKVESKPNQWNYMQIDYMTPFPYDESDKFEIYGWYHGKGGPVYIDDLKVEKYVRNY